MAAPERIATYADLIALLTDEQVPFARDDNIPMVEIPTKSPPLEGHVYVRWEKSLPYAQIVHPLVTDVPAERIPALEKCVSLLNHAIALPGFGIDHERGFVYFRLTLPVDPAGITPDFFRLMIIACVNNSRDFYLAVRDVASGALPPEGALGRAIGLDAAAQLTRTQVFAKHN